MRVLLAGGAGFIGSHIADALLARGDEVVAVDNFATGRRDNVAHLICSHFKHIFISRLEYKKPNVDPLL